MYSDSKDGGALNDPMLEFEVSRVDNTLVWFRSQNTSFKFGGSSRLRVQFNERTPILTFPFLKPDRSRGLEESLIALPY
jgi:hypothetical protein